MNLNDLLNNPEKAFENLTDATGTAVVFDPKDMAKELVAYDEPDAATRLLELDRQAFQQIGLRAHEIYSAFAGDHGPILDQAICLAVVEHIEGASRPLKRKRRIYPK